MVSIVTEASHNPNELALEVEPEIDKPAFSPLARRVMLSVEALLGPSNAAWIEEDEAEILIAFSKAEKDLVASRTLLIEPASQ